jgi:hypothetical protein
MVRLSNQTVQFVFDDLIDYLISGKGDKIYKIKNGKIAETIDLKQKYTINSCVG